MTLRCRRSVRESSRWVSCGPGSCGVCRRVPRRPRRVIPRCIRTGRFPWGSTGAAARWCSRCYRAARGCEGRRSTPACPAPRTRAYAGPVRSLGPMSHVRLLRSSAGRDRILRMMASCTCSASCPSGRCRRIVNRVVRSTRVPIALRLPAPQIRSPSQWPGTARSATSVGGRRP